MRLRVQCTNRYSGVAAPYTVSMARRNRDTYAFRRSCSAARRWRGGNRPSDLIEMRTCPGFPWLDHFSVEKLMTFLNALDHDVEIVIRPRRAEVGHISVLALS